MSTVRPPYWVLYAELPPPGGSPFYRRYKTEAGARAIAPLVHGTHPGAKITLVSHDGEKQVLYPAG